jgi:preprotein translocase subunit YajC
MQSLIEIFTLVSTAYAQTEQAVTPQPGFAEVFSKMMPMFAIVFLIFYFMVIKPQQTKLKTQEDLLKSLKKGDQVVTTGGIIARVASIEEDCVVLDISNNVKLKVEKLNIVKRKELVAESAKTAA